MARTSTQFTAITIAGVLAIASIALMTGQTEAATANPTATRPVAEHSSAVTGHLPDAAGTIVSSGNEHGDDGHGAPGPDVPAGLRSAIAERTLDADSPDGTAGSGVTHQQDGTGGQVTLTNSETSSYGATLASYGACGGAQTGFQIDAAGFEWIRISMWSSAGYWPGDWARVAQRYHVAFPLPITTPGVAYIVDGWDETPAGGDMRTVITSFDRIPDLTYTTWIC